jgi:hypothetical protein
MKRVDIKFKHTDIFMGCKLLVKAQFATLELSKEGHPNEKTFTYTYDELGVYGFDSETFPSKLKEDSDMKDILAIESLERLSEEINTRNNIVLKPEGRIRLSGDFTSAYTRSEYGYAVCLLEKGDKDLKELQKKSDNFDRDFIVINDVYFVETVREINPEKGKSYYILELFQNEESKEDEGHPEKK